MTAASRYRVYGLTVEADLPLPELAPAAGAAEPDVIIRRGAAGAVPAAELVRMHAADALLAAPASGCFQVQGGSRVEYRPRPGLSDAALRLFLLGPALAMVLHQRGHLVLHASTVGLDLPHGAVAAAFMGESGEGKSTAAAKLYERGHRMVADDIIAIPDPLHDTAAGPPRVEPGFSTLKLWPASVRALARAEEDLPLVLPEAEDYPRRELHATRGFAAQPLPLRALFVLESGPELQCEPLPPPRALMALVRNSYWAGELPAAQRARHFRQCAALVSRLAVYRLCRPRDLRLLPRVAEMVERTLAALPPAPRNSPRC